MLSDDELGERLRADLHAIGDSIDPSPEFWERFMPASSPRRKRRRALRLLAPAVVALAAVVAVVLLALSGSRPSAAYAVTVEGDSVKITLNQVSAVTGLNAELKRLHLPFRAVRMSATCRTHLDLTYIGGEHRPASIHLLRGRLPKDTTVILAAQETSKDRVTFAFGRVKGQVPACVSSKGVGPGLPGFSPTTSITRTPSPTPGNG